MVCFTVPIISDRLFVLADKTRSSRPSVALETGMLELDVIVVRWGIIILALLLVTLPVPLIACCVSGNEPLPL